MYETFMYQIDGLYNFCSLCSICNKIFWYLNTFIEYRSIQWTYMQNEQINDFNIHVYKYMCEEIVILRHAFVVQTRV